MLFFGKTEYKEMEMSFKFGQLYDAYMACVFDFEAYGEIDGAMKYCFASYYYRVVDDDKYNNLINRLLNFSDKKVLVKLKYKNGVLKDFKIDLNSLSNCYNIPEIQKFELCSWGLNSTSAFN